ncbi:MAG: toll/interleukin-1 receptor domain-containing protein [Planctomycetia bacterium]|nr:toll/interleukin-1 receptor domain-containing protein [Planctomycetia bacterium]
MPIAHARVFISHSTKDAKFTDTLVERLRDHYITTWYAPRHMPGGYFKEGLEQALIQCDWFILVLSDAALHSEWVKWEVDTAMTDPRYKGKIIPVLAEACDWKNLHEYLGRYQLFDYVTQPKEAENRLLQHLGVTPHTFPPQFVGDVKMPVHVFVGGDGVTRFRPGDIICDGPGLPSDDSRLYHLPPDVQTFADIYLPKRKAECDAQGKLFVNNRQVRLNAVTWASSNPAGGMANIPLRLTLGWTWYYHTAVTNAKTDERLPEGLTIGQTHAAPINNLLDCRLSNPMAVNMSVITRDNQICYVQRGVRTAVLAGGFQPAVSGDGQPEDLTPDGTYDPFHNALREAKEECLGLLPESLIQDVCFFGLGRWMKTRFPFLFGEIRVDATAKQLRSFTPPHPDGERLFLPFTVEDVTSWVAEKYQDMYFGRSSWPVASPIFSLLQSLRYQSPERWLEVIDRLDIPDIPPSN